MPDTSLDRQLLGRLEEGLRMAQARLDQFETWQRAAAICLVQAAETEKQVDDMHIRLEKVADDSNARLKALENESLAAGGSKRALVAVFNAGAGFLGLLFAALSLYMTWHNVGH